MVSTMLFPTKFYIKRKTLLINSYRLGLDGKTMSELGRCH